MNRETTGREFRILFKEPYTVRITSTAIATVYTGW